MEACITPSVLVWDADLVVTLRTVAEILYLFALLSFVRRLVIHGLPIFHTAWWHLYFQWVCVFGEHFHCTCDIDYTD